MACIKDIHDKKRTFVNTQAQFEAAAAFTGSSRYVIFCLLRGSQLNGVARLDLLEPNTEPKARLRVRSLVRA